MSGSQNQDYLQIAHSLLQSRRQWQKCPQIIHLTFKAIQNLLDIHNQRFMQHKVLINQQNLHIKQLDMLISDKKIKKIQNSYSNFIKQSQYNSRKKQQDNISQYEKLIKQSRYTPRKYGTTQLQQLKTISQIIADKKIAVYQTEVANRFLTSKLQQEQKLIILKQQIKNKIFDIQKQKRQLKQMIFKNKNQIQQLQQKIKQSKKDDKFSFLQNNNKKLSENLSTLINHLQQNYYTKQQISILYSKEFQNKINQKQKNKIQNQKHMHQQYINKIISNHINKIRIQDKKQFLQFKQYIQKQIGNFVKIDIVNNLIDTFQKDLLQKYRNMTSQISKFQLKIQKQNQIKQKINKIEKKPEKQRKCSPSKSAQLIQGWIQKLQRTIVEKQSENFKYMQKIQQKFTQKLSKHQNELKNEFQIKQKHVCQVLQQMLLDHKKQNTKSDNIQTLTSLKKLIHTNIYSLYHYLGTKQCLKDSCIVFQKQQFNNGVDNVIWKKQNALIHINAQGLYKIQIGIYGQLNSPAILLINNTPIAEIKLLQKKMTTSVSIRGAYYSQILLIPPKSKITIRVSQNFYGQAFLLIKKI